MISVVVIEIRVIWNKFKVLCILFPWQKSILCFVFGCLGCLPIGSTSTRTRPATNIVNCFSFPFSYCHCYSGTLICHIQTWLLPLPLCWLARCPVEMLGPRPPLCCRSYLLCAKVWSHRWLHARRPSLAPHKAANWVQRVCFGLALPDRLPYWALLAAQQYSGHFRSAEKGLFKVPFVLTFTRKNRDLSVLGPSVWNRAPRFSHRFTERTLKYFFYKLLKSVISGRAWVGSASQ